MTVYCAPAARPFRCLHIAEDGADFHAPAGSEALTLCGLVMAWADLWLPLKLAPGDQVCRPCRGLPEPQAQQLELATTR